MQFIRDRHLDLRNNALYAFMTANLALNNHEAAYGMQVLEHMKKGPEYLNMPVLNYEMGTLKLYHLELQDAIHYFSLFVNHFKGKFYVKDALFKLSWAYYLQGNMSEADKYRKMVVSRGNDEVDADKVALREVKKPGWPDATILRARMLMNGGFFRQALDTIRQKKIEDYTRLIDKIEYAYFLGRIYDELGKDQTAISLYDATIKGGAGRPEYYAARAALQVAFIYEKRKDTTHALQYFRTCLQMDEEEYKSTLDQRAKAGINRLTIR
jgi:tetratricopeptide (TPR) repeat protein